MLSRRLKQFDTRLGSRELDHILDLYWGGSERRITGLTLRIFAVNAVALLILLIGVFYLGQYQNNLIEARLETFKTEIQLLSAAISEVAIQETGPVAYNANPVLSLNTALASSMVETMSRSMNKRIRVYDIDGDLIIDSSKIGGSADHNIETDLYPPKDSLYTIEILKSLTAVIIDFLPDRRILPPFPDLDIQHAGDIINTREAMEGKLSLAAWINKENRIMLSAAGPILRDSNIIGSVLLTRVSNDIEEGISAVWLDIFRAFGITLCITILLSIYLSGAIARPLKKLAKAAEKIQHSHSTDIEIPDFSNRHDEIGELSIVLREMTRSLKSRMDSIERFAADVAHELKNPLTSLKSAVETASIVKKQEDKEKLMKIIQHDIVRLDRLITDISNASRLDTELSREIFRPVNINELLYNILDRYRAPLDRQAEEEDSRYSFAFVNPDGIHIQLQTENNEPLTVMGSELKLSQVIINLLTNAMSFSTSGQIVVIEAYRRLNAVIITIEDEGPGIPENKLETIFERFYSERPSHEDYGRHSGLGLSICKQIITAHQGRLYAENRKDVQGRVIGARFSIILQKV